MDERDPGIGLRVRAVRSRLGWSREALAFHSGVSWAGIGQVESGRRRDVRSGTLVALAQALGVSIDYLVLGRCGEAMFEHRLSMYSSDADLMAAAVPFIASASDHSEAALAVTSKRNISLLRRALGDAARGVQFADSSRWFSSPIAALNAYEEFCATRLDGSAPWVRIVADVGWARRSASEVRSWIRLESLLHVAFAHQPVSMLCLCDKRSLKPGVERRLLFTHPEPGGDGERTYGRSDADPRTWLLQH